EALRRADHGRQAGRRYSASYGKARRGWTWLKIRNPNAEIRRKPEGGSQVNAAFHVYKSEIRRKDAAGFHRKSNHCVCDCELFSLLGNTRCELAFALTLKSVPKGHARIARRFNAGNMLQSA